MFAYVLQFCTSAFLCFAGRQMQISSNSFLFQDSNKIDKLNLNILLSSHKHYQPIRVCHNLTHVNATGKAKMVDVSNKEITYREASATGVVEVGPKIANLIKANNIQKGDVLSLVQMAGIMGAKKTSELIPLCHLIYLNSVDVVAKLDLNMNAILITATVRCSGKTGVEMEALTAVSIGALTVYDMCKAVSHDILIKEIRLMQKSGGKKNFHRCNENNY